jgi:short-subunit dehydrogenase
VTCAGYSKPSMMLSQNVDDFKNHMDVNFYGAIKFINPVVKRMTMRRHRGRVVLIGDSLGTHYAIPGFSSYACSKAALEQLAYQLRAELSAHEIRVHLFLPPPMATKLRSDSIRMYPLVTKSLMSKTKGISPADACHILLNGIAQDKYIICGSYGSGILEASRSHTLHFYSLFVGPVAMLYRHFYDYIIHYKMSKYRPFKTINSK